MGGVEEAGFGICKEVILRVFGDVVTCILTDFFCSGDIKHTPNEGIVG